ncbi:S-layer homology domain-containing protein [Paenibacillus albus]|uniref:S-layer homology domain-containing protein n=1 Tax=Paenibacillus albus TaxID=2495582 RepID=A0A3Q8X1Y1_9BACL|nr:S-layer homology domain-containing protein [Paenibacillus albus]AZN38594.1 S-layer homology domain-containing protein [Paenibacillus albus]
MTTIATSLVAGSIAGLPFSNKGVAQQLGLANVASAATVTTYDQFLARLDKIHTALIAGGDAQSVRDLRGEIGGLTDSNAINPLWVYVPDAVKNDADVDFKQVLFDTFQALGSIMYSTRNDEIDAIRSNVDLQEALVELATITGTDKLTVNDLLAFIDAVEKEAVNQVSTNLDDLILDGSNGMINSLIKASVKSVLSKDLEVSKVLNWFKDNTDATNDELSAGLTDTFANFTTALPSGSAATKALMIAFVRAEAKSSVVSSGRTKTYSLSLENIKIPSELLEWSKVSGSEKITVNEDGKVVLASSSTSGTATVQATLLGKVVYSGDVSFNIYVGGGGVVTDPNGALNQLKALKDKIANATGEEKEKLIKEAIAKALEAINAISTIDLSKDVVIVDGKATVNVNSIVVSKVTNDISDIVAALKDAAPGAESRLPKINVTFQAGKVDSKDITFNVDAVGVKNITGAGLYGAKFAVNGFSANLPVSQAKNGAVGFNVKNSVPAASTLKAVSDSYDFNLTVDGTAVHQFSQPVEISIPVTLPAGVDKDLLSVYDGKTFFGGVYHDGVITENRDHFSSYVVVENKVAFNDISKVKAWAGRQIEVMAAKGAIQGRASGAFVPNGEVTRAEFAKMLVQALDLDNVLAQEGFSDVNATDWFAPYVAAASEAGIIKGRTATSFAPKATITRAEMAVMVARALEATKGVKASAGDLKALEAFKDANAISASLKDGVAFAANNGLVVGDKGKFNPNATATRAQAAVIIYRAFNFKG